MSDKTLLSVFNNIVERVGSAAVDSCNEIANGVKDTAKGMAELDPNEVTYSIFKGYDNIGEFNSYKTSFKVKNAVQKDNEIKARAFSDYLVFFKRVGHDVPYGNFIEWGTGIAGMGAPSPYDYTTKPWDERTKHQAQDSGTFGMVANPHWTIAFHQFNAKKKDIFYNNLRKYI